MSFEDGLNDQSGGKIVIGKGHIDVATGLRVLEVLYTTGNNQDKHGPLHFFLSGGKEFPVFKDIKGKVASALGRTSIGGIHIRDTRILQQGEEVFQVFGEI